jgi:hypothetical protein
MKNYNELYEEVHSYLLRELITEDLSLDTRAFINSMLIISDLILTNNTDVFHQVFAEALELEIARRN